MTTRGGNAERQVRIAIENNETADRVLIPNYWFEMDAYGAAVSGILKSIELGLKSPSMGDGEENILVRVWAKLLEEDPALQDPAKNCECGQHCYMILGGEPGNYEVRWAHAPADCPFDCEDCANG